MRTSCIIADILMNMNDNRLNYPEARNELVEMKKIVFQMVRKGCNETLNLCWYAKKHLADEFWKLWEDQYCKDNQIENVPMPLSSEASSECLKYLTENNLSLQFYQYSNVSYGVYEILRYAQKFVKWDVKLNRVRNDAIVIELNQAQTDQKKKLLIRFVEWYQILMQVNSYLKDLH